jgi:restriction endonuclease S subunit
VNVGSIGLVSEECAGGYVSGIYIVFRSKNSKVPPEFILTLLKSDAYKKVIEAYDTKYGAVRANLTYEQLCRIRIPILSLSKLEKFMDHLKGLAEIEKILKEKRLSTGEYLNKILEKK